MHIELNISIRNEHITKIERLNRTMKERIRLVYTELIRVYVRVPGFLVHDIVYPIMLWLNSFPADYGVLATLNLQAIITGQSVEFSKHCLLKFVEYVHTHEDGKNSMESWTLKVLALLPIVNIQGKHYFLNIHTGRVITRFTWNDMSLPTHIRNLFWRLARKSPITLEVLDGLRLEIPDANPDKDKADEDYVPVEDYYNDDDDDDGGGGDGNVDHHVDTNDNGNATIILNTAGPDHDGPISAVVTDQYQIIVKTDAAREKTEYNATASSEGGT